MPQRMERVRLLMAVRNAPEHPREYPLGVPREYPPGVPPVNTCEYPGCQHPSTVQPTVHGGKYPCEYPCEYPRTYPCEYLGLPRESLSIFPPHNRHRFMYT
jgi:hypothetical protein